MAEDINSALNAIRGMLGDNADEKIQSVINSLSGGGNAGNDNDSNNIDLPEIVEHEASNTSANMFNDDSMQYIFKMKGIIDEMSNTNDARSNLLLSLKPYMRDSRKQGIDNAIKLLSLTKLSGLFKK